MCLIIPPMECVEEGCTAKDKNPFYCSGCEYEHLPWFEAGVDLSSQPDQTGYIKPEQQEPTPAPKKKSKSKFNFESFNGGYGEFAVNADKYTKEEAIAVFEYETDCKVNDEKYGFTISTAFVRHRAGVTEDGDRCVCWWLEYEEHPRSCPVWEFHHNIYDDGWCERHPDEVKRVNKRF